MADLRLEVLLAALDYASGPLKAIAKSGKEAAAGLREARAAVRQLNDASGKVRALKEQQQALAEAGRKADDYRRRISFLREGMKDASGTMRRDFAREIGAASRDLARLAKEQTKIRAQMGGTRAALEAAGIDTRDLAAAEERLAAALGTANAQLRAQQQALQAAAERQRRLSQAARDYDRGMARAAQIRGTGAGMMATGAAAGLPLVAVAKQAAEAQSILVDVGITADANAARIAALGRELPGAARRTNQFAADLAAQIQQLTAKGLDLDTAQAAVEPIGRAATAAKAALEDVQGASASLLQNSRVAVRDLPRALDIMTSAGNAGAFELRDMAREFPALTAAAANLGIVGLESTASLAAGLQIARRGTGDAASAANNMLNYLSKLSSPETVKRFEAMGVDLPAAFAQWNRDGLNPLEESAKLVQRLTQGDAFKLGELFGDMQVQGFLKPFLAGLGDYNAIKEEAEKATGASAQQFARRMAEDPLEQLKAAQIALSNAGTSLGEALIPTLRELAQWASRAADAFLAWQRENPALASALVKIAAGAAALAFVGGGLLVVLGSILGPLAMLRYGLALLRFAPLLGAVQALAGTALPALATALRVLGAVVLAHPIVAFIALLTAAGVYVWQNWETLGPKFAALWESIKSGAIAAFEAMKAAIINTFTNLKANLSSIGAAIIDGIKAGIMSRAAALLGTIAEIASKIKNAFKSALSIQSPSRVFAYFGSMLMEGLGIGMQRAEGGPLKALANTAGRLRAGAAGLILGTGAAALSAATAAAGPAAIGASGGDTINININLPAGWRGDARDIAAEVRRALEARDRAKARDRRAALYDID